MRLGGGGTREGKDRLAALHAAGGNGFSQNFALRRFVGIGLVDDGHQIDAVGELARNRVFHRLAGAKRLHDEV